MTRTLIAIVSLCCGSIALATEIPSDFVGIAWGAPAQQTQQELAKRPGVTLANEASEKISFTGGTWAEMPVREWIIEFNGGKFWQATIHLAETGGQPLYDTIRGSLKAKYGKYWEGKGPGHAEARWTFKDSPASKGDKEIVLWHDFRKKTVWVSYANYYFGPASSRTPGKKSKDL